MTPIIEALIRAVDGARAAHHREFAGPVKLTATQARQLLDESGQQPPTDEEWAALVAAGLPDSTVLGLPIDLVDTDEESTMAGRLYRTVDRPGAVATPRYAVPFEEKE